MSGPRFRVGQRVTRRKDVYAVGSPILHGTVTRRYRDRTQFGWYPELYEVTWDGNDELFRGFLPHGLSPEPVA